MKFSLLLILSLSSFFSIGQKTNWPPVFYLDSSRIDFSKTYIDPKSIKNINVEKGIDSLGFTNGRIWMTSVKPILFLSMHHLIDEKKLSGVHQFIFLIDNQILMDTNAVRIDPSFIRDIKIVKGTDIIYFKKTIPDFIYLNIISNKKTEENILRIRGFE